MGERGGRLSFREEIEPFISEGKEKEKKGLNISSEEEEEFFYYPKKLIVQCKRGRGGRTIYIPHAERGRKRKG